MRRIWSRRLRLAALLLSAGAFTLPSGAAPRAQDAPARNASAREGAPQNASAPKKGDPALFDPIASVVTHPRCINCHQAEFPRQTDARIRHTQMVVRGADGHGSAALPCQSCHQAANSADGRVPGVATWHLAPASMKWEGLSKAAICEQLKDPQRNGNRRTAEQVVEHMRVDPLVLWAWQPGAGRSTPVLSHEAFVTALEAWASAGMPCPTDSSARRPSR